MRRATRGASAWRGALPVLVVMWMLLPVAQVQGDVPAPARPAPVDAHAWSVPSNKMADAEGIFTENLGQWGSDVRFVAKCPFGHAVFGAGGVTYDVVKGDGEGHRLRVSFSSKAPVEPVGIGDLGYPTNFFLGNEMAGWVTGARSYSEIVYRDVWPGVDVRYRASDGTLKYDVIVSAGADVDDVRFVLDGNEGLEVAPDRLDMGLAEGMVLQDRDLSAWNEGGEPVDVRFIGDGNAFGFKVDERPAGTLVIDPVVVHASTLLGGAYDEQAADVEVDGDGNVYVTGTSSSSDYPTTPGAYSTEHKVSDIVVTKLNHNCSRVIWSTFIGGSSTEVVCGLERDEEGNLYIEGDTWSVDFPVTNGTFQGRINQGQNNYQNDFYVCKLGPDGDELVYSTYVGGSGPESAGDIKVLDGMAAVVGRTDSHDFPTEGGGYGANHGDALLFILSENGSTMVETNFWGGSGAEKATSLEFDRYGDIVVGGFTTSIDFWVTPGAFQAVRPSFQSGFISKYSPSVGKVLFSTYIGGSLDSVYDVAVDDDLDIYIAGQSYWMGVHTSYPTTPDAFDRRYNGRTDAFITKMSSHGMSLVYSTLLGGDGDDHIYDIEVDGDGNAVVTGDATSGVNFTVTEGCHDPTFSGPSEGFLFVLDRYGEGPVYSSFHGGVGEDSAVAVDIDDRDNYVLVGTSSSKDISLTDDGFQTRIGGGTDLFVSIIGELSPPSSPRNLTATGREGHIELAWEPPLHDGNYTLRDYIVHKGTSTDGLRFYRALGNATSMDDVEVEYGVLYYYAVFATNGKGQGPRSNVAFARSVTVPDPAVNLTCVLNFASVALAWEHPAFTGGLPLREYRLYRSAHGGPTSLVATLDPGALGFEDLDVEDGTTYTYMVTAVNEHGKAKTSPTVTVRTHGVPTPPREVRHTYGEVFIRLEWEAPEDDYGLPVAGYEINRRTGEGPEELLATVTTPSIRAFVDAEVDVGVVYVYRITALNAKGSSPPSEGHEAMAMVRPGPPRDVAAQAEVSAVRVTWSVPEHDGASPVLGYWVYHATGPDTWANVGGVFVEGRVGVALVFLHDAPYDSVARRYRVTAFNAEGESDPSEVATTKAYEVPGAPRAPRLAWGDGELTLSWDAPATDGGTPVLSYTVYRRVAGEADFVAVVTVSALIGHYVDDTTVNGVEYTYRVSARNLAGEGATGVEVSGVPAGLPGAPEHATAVGLNASARLSWSAPASTGGLAITGYRVYGRSDGLLGQLIAELGADAREHHITDLENAKTYLFAVTALTPAGESAMSDIVEVMPVGPPSAPRGLLAVWADDHVHLTWSTPLLNGGLPVTGFRLHRDDREPGNWTVLGAIDVSFIDRDVMPGHTYNYTIHALNDAGGGPSVTVALTVPEPSEEPPRARQVDKGPVIALVLGLALIVVLVSVLDARRGRGQGP